MNHYRHPILGVLRILGTDRVGHYGEDVFQAVKAHNEQAYGNFSTLLRMTFDAALAWRQGNVTVGATVRNLGDVRRYFTSSINGTQLTPGPGRELLVNLQLDI